jgi:hypothetical protein
MQSRATTRRRRRSTTFALLTAALLLSPTLPSPSAAPQQKAAAVATPEQKSKHDAVPAFVVTSLNGRTLNSAELPMRENWVLVYVRPDCGPCETVFRALGDDQRKYRDPRRSGADLAEQSRQEEARARFARREAAAAKATAATPANGAAQSSVKQTTMKCGTRRGYFANVEDAPRKLIIVVGGGTVAQVKQMAARMPWIPEGSWYADPSNEVASKFKWMAAPVITGVSKNVVMWSYAGVPPQGLPLRSLMSAWHERREGSPQQPPSEPRP